MKPLLPFFNYTVRNQSGDTLDIAIDGDIVDAETQEMYARWFDDDTSVSFKSFRDQINRAVANGVKTINGTINSPGGQVTEAMAMHDFIVELQDKGITVNLKGTGIVASAATYPLMASKTSSMTANSWFMIHNVSGFAYGDVNQVENAAKQLRKFNDAIRDFYASATGLPKETISGMMNKESWMTADEAKEKGFVKCTTGAATFSNSIKPENWLFSNRTVLNAYNSSISIPSPMDFTKINDAITKGFENLAEKLGITNKTEGAKEALTEFTNSITTAMKEALPTEESIQEMVNKAVGNLKELPKEVTDAISNTVVAAVTASDALKNLATKDDLKNSVSKDDLKKVEDELEETKKAIANRTAGTGKARNSSAADQPTTAADHPGISWGDTDDE